MEPYNNTGALHLYEAIALVALSVILLVLNLVGVTHLSYWIVAGPFALVVLFRYLFILITNAFHRALYLDGCDQREFEVQNTFSAMTDAVTFDAAKMLASINADDIAGNA